MPQLATRLASKTPPIRASRSDMMCRCSALVAVLLIALQWAGLAADSADGWLEDHAAVHPVNALKPDKERFASLRAESLVGKLKVYLVTGQTATVIVLASHDAPGHWRARDWRRIPMSLRGARFEAELPVEDVDVPVVYAVESVAGGTTNISPLRVCNARQLGLDEPSREPWAFIEGFELGHEGWELAGETTPGTALELTKQGHDGNQSLSVALPAGSRSVALTTTRLRGWKIRQHRALGVRLWLKAGAGSGIARITLVANARTDKQTVFAFPEEVALRNAWSKVELPLSRVPELLQGEIDLMTVEFVGVGPAQFLVDDLELIKLLRDGPVSGK